MSFCPVKLHYGSWRRSCDLCSTDRASAFIRGYSEELLDTLEPQEPDSSEHTHPSHEYATYPFTNGFDNTHSFNSLNVSEFLIHQL